MSSRVLASRCVRQLSKTILCGKPTPYHVRTLAAMPISRDIKHIVMPTSMTPNLMTCRYKSKKKSKKVQEAESDDEGEKDKEKEEEEEEEGSSEALPGEKEKILKLAQIRIDKLLRLSLNNSRIVDEAFLEGRLRRNDEKVAKKAGEVFEGDVLDVEVGPDPKNKDFVKVHRVEVLEIKQGNTHSSVRVLVSKGLTVKPVLG